MHARYLPRHAHSIPAVSARGLTKSFARGLARAPDRVIALDAVDLDVHASEIVGLVGNAGAGKTTLLQCVCGLLRCDSGSVRAPRGVAYVAAVPLYYPFVTPRDVLELSIARHGAVAARPDLIERTLCALELGQVAAGRIAALPRGILKRIAVAEALVLRPRAMLVDSNPADTETPFDDITLRALEAYAYSGAALVVAARAASAVTSVATRVVSLESGRNSSQPGRYVAERLH